jgi:uncharacterized protein YkwD
MVSLHGMRGVVAAPSLIVVALLLPLHVALAAPEQAPSSAPNSVVVRVLDLTNAERTKVGAAPLTLSAELTVAAQSYSEVLASGSCFEHTCGPIPDFADRDAAAGYVGWTAIGENLAGGFKTPEAAVAGWMASPGHRSNILSASFTEIGVGVAGGSSRFGMCWTQEFGSRDDSGVADGDN